MQYSLFQLICSYRYLVEAIKFMDEIRIHVNKGHGSFIYSLEQKQNKIVHEVHITFHYIFLYEKFFYLDIFQEISKVIQSC